MKLKKVVTCVTSIILSFSSINFTLGSEIDVLNFRDAVKKAIEYSGTLKSYDEENEITKREISGTKLNFVSSETPEQISNLAIQLKELYAKLEKNKLSANDEKEAIEFSVLSFFINTINAENNLKLYEEELTLKEKKLKISETKLKYGKISKNDYENEQIEYKNLIKEKEELQNLIDDSYVSLNKVLGNNLNIIYNLDLGEEILYDKIGEVNLDSEITLAIDRNNSIRSQRETVDIAKYSLSLFISGTGNDTREAKIVNYNKELRNLEDQKTTLKENITKNYNEIIKLENEYDSNIAELENLKKQLQIKELNLKLGKITAIEIEEHKYENKKLENTMQEQIYQHELLMRKFKNSALL